jgi:hypothetical protein
MVNAPNPHRLDVAKRIGRTHGYGSRFMPEIGGFGLEEPLPGIAAV